MCCVYLALRHATSLLHVVRSSDEAGVMVTVSQEGKGARKACTHGPGSTALLQVLVRHAAGQRAAVWAECGRQSTGALGSDPTT